MVPQANRLTVREVREILADKKNPPDYKAIRQMLTAITGKISSLENGAKVEENGIVREYAPCKSGKAYPQLYVVVCELCQFAITHKYAGIKAICNLLSSMEDVDNKLIARVVEYHANQTANA